jgi:hypothetical protein
MDDRSPGRALLCCAVLCCAVLCCAVLCCAATRWTARPCWLHVYAIVGARTGDQGGARARARKTRKVAFLLPEPQDQRAVPETMSADGRDGAERAEPGLCTATSWECNVNSSLLLLVPLRLQTGEEIATALLERFIAVLGPPAPGELISEQAVASVGERPGETRAGHKLQTVVCRGPRAGLARSTCSKSRPARLPVPVRARANKCCMYANGGAIYLWSVNRSPLSAPARWHGAQRLRACAPDNPAQIDCRFPRRPGPA